MSLKPEVIRLLLILAWFLFIAGASLWIPAYDGQIDRQEEPVYVYLVPYAGVAALAVLTVRERARSVRAALVTTLPMLTLLGLAALAGVAANAGRAEFRGGPLDLYLGIAVWTSWAVLVVTTAVVSRTKWNGAGGLGVGSAAAFIGFVYFIARID